MSRWGRRLETRPWTRVVTVLVAVLAIYFVVPVDAERAPLGVLAGVVISIVALVMVVAAVAREVRGARRLSGWHLLLALEVALVVFSFVYYFVATRHPGEFAGLSTRLDALYFSTATAATVGYGDVHPVGQEARGLVTLHMIFNIVFIAAVVNLAKARMSERRAAAQDRVEPPDGTE
jgi:hypothetical protein